MRSAVPTATRNSCQRCHCNETVASALTARKELAALYASPLHVRCGPVECQALRAGGADLRGGGAGGPELDEAFSLKKISLSRSPENGPGFKLGKFGPMSKKKKMPEIRSAFSLGTSHENPRNVRSPPPPPGPAGPRSGPRLPGPRPAPKPPAPGFRGSLGGPGRPAPARPAPGARGRLARPRPAGGPGPAAPKSASGS